MKECLADQASIELPYYC